MAPTPPSPKPDVKAEENTINEAKSREGGPTFSFFLPCKDPVIRPLSWTPDADPLPDSSVAEFVEEQRQQRAFSQRRISFLAPAGELFVAGSRLVPVDSKVATPPTVPASAQSSKSSLTDPNNWFGQDRIVPASPVLLPQVAVVATAKSTPQKRESWYHYLSHSFTELVRDGAQQALGAVGKSFQKRVIERSWRSRRFLVRYMRGMRGALVEKRAERDAERGRVGDGAVKKSRGVKRRRRMGVKKSGVGDGEGSAWVGMALGGQRELPQWQLSTYAVQELAQDTRGAVEEMIRKGTPLVLSADDSPDETDVEAPAVTEDDRFVSSPVPWDTSLDTSSLSLDAKATVAAFFSSKADEDTGAASSLLSVLESSHEVILDADLTELAEGDGLVIASPANAEQTASGAVANGPSEEKSAQSAEHRPKGEVREETLPGTSVDTLNSLITSYTPIPLTSYPTIINTYTNPPTHRSALCTNLVHATTNLSALYKIWQLAYSSLRSCANAFGAMPSGFGVESAQQLVRLVKDAIRDVRFWEEKVEALRQVGSVHAAFWREHEVDLRKVGWVDVEGLEGDVGVFEDWVEGVRRRVEVLGKLDEEKGEESLETEDGGNSERDGDGTMAELMGVLGEVEKMLLTMKPSGETTPLPAISRPLQIIQEVEEEALTSPLSAETPPPTTTPPTESPQTATPSTCPPTKPLPTTKIPTIPTILTHVPRFSAQPYPPPNKPLPSLLIPRRSSTPTKPKPTATLNVFDRLYSASKKTAAESSAIQRSLVAKPSTSSQKQTVAKAPATALRHGLVVKERSFLSKTYSVPPKTETVMKTVVVKDKVSTPEPQRKEAEAHQASLLNLPTAAQQPQQAQAQTPSNSSSASSAESASSQSTTTETPEATIAIEAPDPTTHESDLLSYINDSTAPPPTSPLRLTIFPFSPPTPPKSPPPSPHTSPVFTSTLLTPNLRPTLSDPSIPPPSPLLLSSPLIAPSSASAPTPPARNPPTEPRAMRIPHAPASELRRVPRYTSGAPTQPNTASLPPRQGAGRQYNSASLPSRRGGGGGGGVLAAYSRANGLGGSEDVNANASAPVQPRRQQTQAQIAGSLGRNGNMQPPRQQQQRAIGSLGRNSNVRAYGRQENEFDVGYAAGLFAAGFNAASYGWGGGRGRGDGRGGYGSLGRMGRY